MKKALSILFLSVYFLYNTGLIINIHYCMDRIKSVSLFVNAEKCCCDSKEVDNKCCTDKEYIFNPTSQEQNTPISYQLPEIQALLVFLLFNNHEIKFEPLEDGHIYYDPPPPIVEIWRKNCSFLFYG